LQRRCNAAATPLQHRCNAAATPLQRRCCVNLKRKEKKERTSQERNITILLFQKTGYVNSINILFHTHMTCFLQRCCNAAETPMQRRCNAAATPLQRRCNAAAAPLLSTSRGKKKKKGLHKKEPSQHYCFKKQGM